MPSANTLFHFTRSQKNLLGILQNGFYPRYSLETLQFIGRVDKRAFPMVCFCDIPFSQMRLHLKTYGFYGIGLSKDWGTRKHLNPVIYLSQASSLWKAISRTVSSTFQAIEKGETPHYWKAELQRFIKPYQGNFVHKRKTYPDYRFYDEREWRFVPDWYVDVKFALTEDEFKSEEKVRLERILKRKEPLKFEPNDIRYLIVRDEKEIRLLVQALKKVFGLKYTQETIEILISRIMTCDQIERDV